MSSTISPLTRRGMRSKCANSSPRSSRRWDLPQIHADGAREPAAAPSRLCALRAGRYTPWDLQPMRDASKLYVRNDLDLGDFEAMARFPPFDCPTGVARRGCAAAGPRRPAQLLHRTQLICTTVTSVLFISRWLMAAHDTSSPPAASPLATEYLRHEHRGSGVWRAIPNTTFCFSRSRSARRRCATGSIRCRIASARARTGRLPGGAPLAQGRGRLGRDQHRILLDPSGIRRHAPSVGAHLGRGRRAQSARDVRPHPPFRRARRASSSGTAARMRRAWSRAPRRAARASTPRSSRR